MLDKIGGVWDKVITLGGVFAIRIAKFSLFSRTAHQYIASLSFKQRGAFTGQSRTFLNCAWLIFHANGLRLLPLVCLKLVQFKDCIGPRVLGEVTIRPEALQPFLMQKRLSFGMNRRSLIWL
jgi:hypothetical protein